MWQIFVLSCQWRLLTGWYVIMAPLFIACDYIWLRKASPSFWKRTRFFLQVTTNTASYSAVSVCDIQWVHIFQYFSFFIMIFWTVPYASFTRYIISYNVASWSRRMTVPTLFSSILSATKIHLLERLSSTIFSWPLLNFCTVLLTCWTLIVNHRLVTRPLIHSQGWSQHLIRK